MHIKFDKRLFNPLFWQIQEYKKKKILIVYGGSGASKSYSICQHEIFKALSEPNIRILFLSKTLPQAKISTIPLIKEILEKWQLWEHVKFNKSDLTYTFPNGSEIIVKDLFDSERLKGVKASRIWVDEVTECERDEILELLRRLRGKELKNPQVILSFNPVSAEHWIKSTFVDKEGVDERIKVLKVTYKDNKFLTEEDKKDLEILKEYDYNHYRIYALGEWGHLTKGGEVYPKFKTDLHVKDLNYNPEEPLILSFDENVNPFCAVTVAQVKYNDVGTEINFIDEVAVEDGTIEDTCEEIINRYYNHYAGVVVTGDATSRKQDAKLERGQNFFTLIEDYLNRFKPVMQIYKKNAGVLMRHQFINKALYDDKEIKIRVSSKCHTLINDFVTVKMNAKGDKHKQMGTDKVTKRQYQKVGHMLDSAEYLITHVCNEEFSEFEFGRFKTPIIRLRPSCSY